MKCAGVDAGTATAGMLVDADEMGPEGGGADHGAIPARSENGAKRFGSLDGGGSLARRILVRSES